MVVTSATRQARRDQRASRSNRHKPTLPTKRRKRERADDDNTADRARQPFLDVADRRSESLEAYYTVQKIVPADELPTLFASLAQPLPTSFRVSADSRFCDEVCKKLEGHFSEIFNGLTNPESNDPIVPPTRLSWYPGGLAWSVATPRFLVRRNNVLAPFHKFLVQMNDLGAINRQEAVSMVPPLLLDMKPGQSVIDLCAAPGSKSAQLLEALAMSPSAPKGLSAGGLVVANDVDIKRCWMLAHQLRRFGAPNLVVTHHDAQSFPAVIQFDRVLCDVPCTGDGTLRKAPDMWRRWNPNLGNGIHRLQKNILRRGVELLKQGGRIIYSTCSMNPVENEAVVADALRFFGSDVLELIDVSAELPLLRRRHGLRTWRVKDTASATNSDSAEQSLDTGRTLDSNSENPTQVPNHTDGSSTVHLGSGDGWFSNFDQVPERRRRRVVQSLFPPSDEELTGGHFPLERCLRLVPYDQDTGAFFVAVLRKAAGKCSRSKVDEKNLNDTEASHTHVKTNDGQSHCANPEPSISASQDNDDQVTEEVSLPGEDGVDSGADSEKKNNMDGNSNSEKADRRKERASSRLITDDPLVGLERVNDTVLTKLADFYGLDVSSCRNCLMTRGSEAERFKRILVVSPAVRHLLRMSIGSPEGSAAGIRGRLRVVNAGVRIFERTGRRDAVLPFRILSDGTRILKASMTKRIISVDREDLFKMLLNEQMDIRQFTLREVRAQLDKMSSGSALMVMGSDQDAEIVLIWKGQYKVTKLMPSEEISAMLMRHGLVKDQNTSVEEAEREGLVGETPTSTEKMQV